jgi:hypothetical protein
MGEKKIWTRIGDEHPGTYFRELRKPFFGFKNNSFMLIRTRDLRDPGDPR